MITDYTGKIPKGWKAIAFGDEEYLKVVSGGTPDTKKSEYWDGDIFWAIPTDITNLNGNHIIKDTERKITQAGVDGSSAKPLPIGSVLMTSRATIGEAAINEVPITTNQGFQSFVCSDKLYNYYLLYSIHLWKNKIAHLGGQSTFKEVNRTLLKKFQIPIPEDIEEQRSIADLIRSVDDAILSVDYAVDVAKRVKRGLMQDLLTRGIGYSEFKDDKTLGKIPSTWKSVALGNNEYFELISGGTPDTKIESYWDGDIPWATPTDITNLKGKNTINNTERKITKEGVDNSSAKILPPGSVLMTSRATIGDAAINEIPMCTNQGFQSLICSKLVYNYYLLYLIQLNKLKISRLGGQSTFKEVNKTLLKKFRIGIPTDYKEQEKISSFLLISDKKIELEKLRKEKLLRIKKGLMQDLLTGRKRLSSFKGDS